MVECSFCNRPLNSSSIHPVCPTMPALPPAGTSTTWLTKHQRHAGKAGGGHAAVDCRLSVCNCHFVTPPMCVVPTHPHPSTLTGASDPLHRCLTHRVAPDEDARGGCRGGAAPLAFLLTAKPNKHTHTLSYPFHRFLTCRVQNEGKQGGCAALPHPSHCRTAPVQYAGRILPIRSDNGRVSRSLERHPQAP